MEKGDSIPLNTINESKGRLKALEKKSDEILDKLTELSNEYNLLKEEIIELKSIIYFSDTNVSVLWDKLK